MRLFFREIIGISLQEREHPIPPTIINHHHPKSPSKINRIPLKPTLNSPINFYDICVKHIFLQYDANSIIFIQIKYLCWFMLHSFKLRSIIVENRY
jgi:hypothetical protein